MIAGKIRRLRRFIHRLHEWRLVLWHEQKTAKFWPMMRALLTGGVSARQYAQRIRTCRKCPIYDFKLKACRKEIPASKWSDEYRKAMALGCGCYVPFVAKTRAPYQAATVSANYMGEPPQDVVFRRGCWGRVEFGPHFGWGDQP